MQRCGDGKHNTDMNTINKIKSDWDNVTKIKVFEIPVFDTRTNENEYILFDISIEKNTMYAKHEDLTKKQSKSKKIAFVKIVLDPIFTLDEHLQELYDLCVNAIIDSDFFELV